MLKSKRQQTPQKQGRNEFLVDLMVPNNNSGQGLSLASKPY